MARGKVGLEHRRLKEQTVVQVAERLRSAPASVIVDYRGLTVAEDGELRRRLRSVGVEYRVVKNSLATLATAQLGLSELDGVLRGPTAVAFSAEDPVAPARELSAFAKDHQKLQVKGGVLEGRVIGAEDVRVLAELPSRGELLARVAAALNAPMVATATVLGAPLRAFATVAERLGQARGEASAPA